MPEGASTPAQLRIPEIEEAVSAGEMLSDLSKLCRRATVAERHDPIRPTVSRVYLDLTNARVAGFTPKSAFWSLCEQVRVDSPRVPLLKPDEVKKRLVAQQAAEVMLVETGGIGLVEHHLNLESTSGLCSLSWPPLMPKGSGVSGGGSHMP